MKIIKRNGTEVAFDVKKIVNANSRYVQLVGVMGHHDISAQKRTKILKIIKENLQNDES